MARSGRPVAMDKTKQAHFCALISLGHTLHDAARLVDVSPVTVRRLANLDPAFRERLNHAERDVGAFPLNTIREEAQKNWKAATWLMERVHYQRFGKRQAKHCYMEDYLAMLEEYTSIVVEAMPDHADGLRLQARLGKLIRLWERDWSVGRGWYARAKREERRDDEREAVKHPVADSASDSDSTVRTSAEPVVPEAQAHTDETALPTNAESAIDSPTPSPQAETQ